MNFASNCIFKFSLNVYEKNKFQAAPTATIPAPTRPRPNLPARPGPAQPSPAQPTRPGSPTPLPPPKSKIQSKKRNFRSKLSLKTFGQNSGPEPYTITINPKPLNPKPYVAHRGFVLRVRSRRWQRLRAHGHVY